MRILCPRQDCAEWFAVRIGKVTASCAFEAMHFVSKGSKQRGDKRVESGSARKAYISELAWGMITRQPVEHYVSEEMDLGKQFEKRARAEYQFLYANGEEIEQTGFVLHPMLDYLGASPDGLLTNGGIELKVPKFKTHRSYLETGIIPPKYIAQIYCNMLCCERDWWDFASFCPKNEQFGYEAMSLPDQFRMYRKRFFRNDDEFQKIEEGATRAIEEAVELVQKLRAMYPEKGAPKSKFAAELELAAGEIPMSEAEAMAAAGEFMDRVEMTP